MLIQGSPACLYPPKSPGLGEGYEPAGMTPAEQAVLEWFQSTPGANPNPDPGAIAYYAQVGLEQAARDVAYVRAADPAVAQQIDQARAGMGLPTVVPQEVYTPGSAVFPEPQLVQPTIPDPVFASDQAKAAAIAEVEAARSQRAQPQAALAAPAASVISVLNSPSLSAAEKGKALIQLAVDTGKSVNELAADAGVNTTEIDSLVLATANAATLASVKSWFAGTAGANPNPDSIALAYYAQQGKAKFLADVAYVRAVEPDTAAAIDADRVKIAQAAAAAEAKTKADAAAAAAKAKAEADAATAAAAAAKTAAEKAAAEAAAKAAADAKAKAAADQLALAKAKAAADAQAAADAKLAADAAAALAAQMKTAAAQKAARDAAAAAAAAAVKAQQSNIELSKISTATTAAGGYGALLIAAAAAYFLGS